MKISILMTALLSIVASSAFAAAPVTVAAPQTSEQWLARMTNMTTNGQAFRDPKLFMSWLNATSEPGFYTTMSGNMMTPDNWTKMMSTGMDPRALGNVMQFTDPAVATKWMAAGMDPQFYTAAMTSLMDPAKMMRWVMMPMDPKVMNMGMQMMNPSTSMNWMMAPMSPSSMNMMMAPMNPNMYTGWMGTSMNPATYGTWGTMLNPATMGGAMDMSALTNMMTPMMAPMTAIVPAAAAVAAPAKK
jgi:hypothetical protein